MQQFAVIGNPIEHSKSPQIHAAFAAQEGITIDYQRVLADSDHFISTVNQLQKQGLVGLNVTVPFKVLAHANCTELNAYAKAAGAVNTLSFKQGVWQGANTDGIGLLRDLEKNIGLVLSGKRVLIIGAGGATRGIVLPLIEAGISELCIANRSLPRAEALATLFSDYPQITACVLDEIKQESYDLVINATSASLNNEVPAIPAAVISSNTLCYDLAYADHDTAFMRWAKTLQAQGCYDGLGMLLEQAAESYFIWRGFRPDTANLFPMLRPQA